MAVSQFCIRISAASLPHRALRLRSGLVDRDLQGRTQCANLQAQGSAVRC